MRDFVQSYLRLPFTAAEIRRAIGIIRTNSVKLEGGRGRGEGAAIFPTYSYANHSCVCNTFTRKTGTRLELVAQVAQCNTPSRGVYTTSRKFPFPVFMKTLC